MGYIVWQYVACQKGTQKVGRVYMAACGAVKRKPQIVMQAAWRVQLLRMLRSNTRRLFIAAATRFERYIVQE